MICPKCRSEYCEGFIECPDCGCKLVSAQEMESRKDSIELMKPVKICECETEMEARMIQEALKKQKIQCFIRGNGSGDYLRLYMGQSFLGSGIYVDESNESEAAKTVLEVTGKSAGMIPEGNEEDVSEWEELEDGIKHAQMKRRIIAGLILGGIIIVVLVGGILTSVL